MNILRRCDNCNKKLKLFEETYDWWGVSGKKLKYCEDCNLKQTTSNTSIKAQKIDNKKIIPNPFSIGNNGKRIIIKPDRKKFKGICEFCDKKTNGELEAFYCKYCREWHCIKHRLPEKHSCTGKLHSLPKEYGVTYSGGQTKIWK